MNTTNALRNQEPPACQCDAGETIAFLQCRIEELTDRLDQLEMHIALNPTGQPGSIWQYLKWRFS